LVASNFWFYALFAEEPILAARSLIAKLSGYADLDHIELATESVVRESTGPVNTL
jgi:hypothetical protein